MQSWFDTQFLNVMWPAKTCMALRVVMSHILNPLHLLLHTATSVAVNQLRLLAPNFLNNVLAQLDLGPLLLQNTAPHEIMRQSKCALKAKRGQIGSAEGSRCLELTSGVISLPCTVDAKPH